MATNNVLSDEDKRSFMRDGYIVLRAAVPSDLVAAALKVADHGYETQQYTLAPKDGGIPQFTAEVKKHPSIGSLFDNCPVVRGAMDDLLGAGNVVFGLQAQVAYRPTDHAALERGITLSDTMDWHSYHIDGGTGNLSGNGTPFTTLVGVCLSPGQEVDELRGQFTVWPGSHVKLHPVVLDRWQRGLIKGAGTVFGGKAHKPNVGEPIRVLMSPGDVVLAHQRLAHSGGLNVYSEWRKNLYFRVRHKRHGQLIEKVLTGSVYTEYEGLHHLVPNIQLT